MQHFRPGMFSEFCDTRSHCAVQHCDGSLHDAPSVAQGGAGVGLAIGVGVPTATQRDVWGSQLPPQQSPPRVGSHACPSPMQQRPDWQLVVAPAAVRQQSPVEPPHDSPRARQHTVPPAGWTRSQALPLQHWRLLLQAAFAAAQGVAVGPPVGPVGLTVIVTVFWVVPPADEATKTTGKVPT